MISGKDYIGVGVGAVLIDKSYNIFLIKRSDHARNETGCWENPGGEVNRGETFEKACKREVKEELGIAIEIWGRLPLQECFLEKDDQHWITQTFVATIPSGVQPKIMEPHKHVGSGWFPLDKLPKPMSVISNKDIENLKSWLKSSGHKSAE